MLHTSLYYDCNNSCNYMSMSNLFSFKILELLHSSTMVSSHCNTSRLIHSVTYGDFMTLAQCWTITSFMRTVYFHYFDYKIGDQAIPWAQHICCKPCYNGLIAWFNGKKVAFNFDVTMIWREPQSHADNCYFWLTNNWLQSLQYPNLPSATRSVPHSDVLPV